MAIFRTLRWFFWYYLHLQQPLHLRIGPAWALARMEVQTEDD